MRTTLDLPQDLLEEAMFVSNTQTKTAVIVKALQDLVRKAKITDLKQYKGQVDLDIDLGTIRNRT